MEPRAGIEAVKYAISKRQLLVPPQAAGRRHGEEHRGDGGAGILAAVDTRRKITRNGSEAPRARLNPPWLVLAGRSRGLAGAGRGAALTAGCRLPPPGFPSALPVYLIYSTRREGGSPRPAGLPKAAGEPREPPLPARARRARPRRGGKGLTRQDPGWEGHAMGTPWAR